MPIFTFMGADLSSVALFYSSSTTFTVSTTISLQCYMGAYSKIHGSSEDPLPLPLCGLPSRWTPSHGPGLLIDVTGTLRWQALAEWTLKMLTLCLTEGALYVEGLLTSSFMAAVGALLSYGDSRLQKVSFVRTRFLLIYLIELSSSSS